MRQVTTTEGREPETRADERASLYYQFNGESHWLVLNEEDGLPAKQKDQLRKANRKRKYASRDQ